MGWFDRFRQHGMKERVITIEKLIGAVADKSARDLVAEHSLDEADGVPGVFFVAAAVDMHCTYLFYRMLGSLRESGDEAAGEWQDAWRDRIESKMRDVLGDVARRASAHGLLSVERSFGRYRTLESTPFPQAVSASEAIVCSEIVNAYPPQVRGDALRDALGNMIELAVRVIALKSNLQDPYKM